MYMEILEGKISEYIYLKYIYLAQYVFECLHNINFYCRMFFAIVYMYVAM